MRQQGQRQAQLSLIRHAANDFQLMFSGRDLHPALPTCAQQWRRLAVYPGADSNERPHRHWRCTLLCSIDAHKNAEIIIQDIETHVRNIGALRQTLRRLDQALLQLLQQFG